jgi:hypothetical protein
MSRSLSSLRLLVVVAAILASSACSNPLAPGEAIDQPNTDPCAVPANVGTPLCPYRH